MLFSILFMNNIEGAQAVGLLSHGVGAHSVRLVLDNCRGCLSAGLISQALKCGLIPMPFNLMS